VTLNGKIVLVSTSCSLSTKEEESCVDKGTVVGFNGLSNDDEFELWI
jgi:hypothetical protein